MPKARYSTFLVFILGLTFSAVAAYILQHRHIHQVQSNFEFQARDRILSLQRSIDTSIVTGKSVVAFFQSSLVVSRTEFASFVTGVFTNAPFIKAFEWVPLVPGPERATYEELASKYFAQFRITERDEDGHLVTRAEHREYFPVFYIEPHPGNENALGFDLGSDEARRTVLEFARDSGMPATTGRISLVQNQPGQWGCLMFFPTYEYVRSGSTVSEQHERRLTGFVVLVFDIAELVESSLGQLTPVGLQLQVYDEKAASTERQLYYSLPHAEAKPFFWGTLLDWHEPFQLIEYIQVNDRNWQIEVTPTSTHYRTSLSMASMLIFFGGLIGTVLLTINLNLIRRRSLDLAVTNIQLERAVHDRTLELEKRNEELETYSYSIAHDLRSPLRTITGFSQILAEDARDRLNETERGHLQRIVSAAKHMAELIDDILQLSRITHQDMEHTDVDLSAIAQSIADRISSLPDQAHPVVWHIQQGVVARGDESLLHILLENLLGNAWKFSAKQANPVIEFSASKRGGTDVYRIHDNGIGFDMQYADKIFGVFQRLHDKSVFEGTGIGLATVQRIVERHGGRIWAEGEEGGGATFYFTLKKDG